MERKELIDTIVQHVKTDVEAGKAPADILMSVIAFKTANSSDAIMMVRPGAFYFWRPRGFRFLFYLQPKLAFADLEIYLYLVVF